MKNNKLFTAFCIMLVLMIRARESDHMLCVSLGNACGVAGALREHGLRTEAYPFDWIVSPFDALCEVLENKFQDFLNEKYLKLRLDGCAVVHRKYNFEFVHDFPTIHAINNTEHEEGAAGKLRKNFIDELPIIRNKYQRRIERLSKVLEGTERVIFFRNRDFTIDQASFLADMLTYQFPSLDFTIILIDDQNEHLDLNEKLHEKVKAFYGPKYIEFKRESPNIIRWKKIFVELGLLDN